MRLIRQALRLRSGQAAAAAVFLASARHSAAQATMPPTNDLPNPYKTVEGWAKLPEGRTWGSTSAVEIDKDGVSIWVAERCGQNNCVGSNLDPILKFDQSGNLVKHFGAGMILSPHGIVVDNDGDLWVTDCTCTVGGGRRGGGPPVDSTKGHQIYKFSPDGKLLMTLGVAGGGRGDKYFWQPNDVLVAPNGDIWVAEGHSSAAGATARVFKFDKTGKLVKTIGDTVRADGFNQPHALA